MQKLLKLRVLTMIVLLVCFTNLQAKNNYDRRPVIEDSVLLSYETIRIANSKLIELSYEKEINIKLKEVIKNDSTIINTIKSENIKLNKTNVIIRKQRNISFITSIVLTLSTFFLLIK